GVWGFLHIDACARFRSKYGLRLYELMTVLVRRDNNSRSFELQELRRCLGAGTEERSKLDGWSALRMRALNPAIDEVNSFAHFTVHMAPLKGYRGRKIERVKFVAREKCGVELPP